MLSVLPCPCAQAPAKVVEEVQAAAAEAREQLAAIQEKVAKFSQLLG